MSCGDVSKAKSAKGDSVDPGVAFDRTPDERLLSLVPPRARCGRQLVWRTERSGILAAEAHGFRLVVLNRSVRDKFARFMVLRRQFGRGSPFALVASGMEADVRTAMEAAEDQGSRLAGLDPDHFASGATV